jgi:hypothetical protein
MSIKRTAFLILPLLGLWMGVLRISEVQSVPIVISNDSKIEIRLEQSGDRRRLDTPGTVIRGEPWIHNERAAWIEETTSMATVRVWTGTATIDLATAQRGHLLDASIGPYGVAWCRFADPDWQIEVDRGGRRTLYGEPIVDDILPVVGETGIAWIGTRALGIWVYTTLGGLADPVRLPGALAQRLRCRGDTLFWVSEKHPDWIAWTFKDGVAGELGKNRLFSYERVQPVSRENPPVLPAPPLSPPVEWEKIPIDPKPDHRTTHAFLSIGEGNALVFAGEIWDASTGQMKGLDSETWILDMEERSFTKIESGAGPSPRCHTHLAYDPSRGLALTFGGGGYEPEKGIFLLNDTWLFDTRKLIWTEVATKKSPPPDSDTGLVYDPNADRFLMYSRGHVWAFDVNEREWNELVVSPGPVPRTCSSMVFDPTGNQVLLWGGYIHPKYFDDTWLLDLETGQWREIGEGPRPAARARSAIAYDPETRCAVVYGGVCGPHSERFEDLWRFDFEQEGWEFLEASNPNSMGKRGGYFGMAKGEDAGEFFIFGGRSDSLTFHHDLWRLHVGKVKEESE